MLLPPRRIVDILHYLVWILQGLYYIMSHEINTFNHILNFQPIPSAGMSLRESLRLRTIFELSHFRRNVKLVQVDIGVAINRVTVCVGTGIHKLASRGFIDSRKKLEV